MDSEGAERIKSPMRDVRNEGLHKREAASRRGRRIYGSILSPQLAFRSNIVALRITQFHFNCCFFSSTEERAFQL